MAKNPTKINKDGQRIYANFLVKEHNDRQFLLKRPESTTSWWVDDKCVYSESSDTWATGYGCNVQFDVCGRGATWGSLMFNLDKEKD